jgi:hypothetical protein
MEDLSSLRLEPFAFFSKDDVKFKARIWPQGGQFESNLIILECQKVILCLPN